MQNVLDDRPFWKGLFNVVMPTPEMDVPEWAETYRVLSGSGSSEKGLWRNERTPYLIEVMKELSPSSKTKEIVCMKGTQLGWTEAATNWVLYNMHLRPCPMLYLMPTHDVALGFSKQRLTPSIEQCEPVKDKFQRRSGNSALEKVGSGIYFSLKGSNSPNALLSNPYENLVLDEIDFYPISVGKKGDPIGQVKNRMANFPNGKIFCLSSPTHKETSQIWELYQESDQRVYMLPCPHCSGHEDIPNNGYFELKFEQLRWSSKTYDDILLFCPICGTGIEEYHKTEMLAKGKWVPQNPGHWRTGFFLSSLYSPIGWLSWAQMAKEFDGAKNNTEKMMAFTNGKLGLPYEGTGETIANEYLSRRVKQYNAQVPNGVLVLTLAVDVQKYRLEYEVRGWGHDEESWGIEYGRIEGATSEIEGEDTVWKRLDALINRNFDGEDGFIKRISCTMIDSGGIDSTTDTVYNFTLPRNNKRVFAIKGHASSKEIYNPPHRRTSNKCVLFIVGTDKAKDLIYSRLKIEKEGAGYYHFPENESAGYDAMAFASLISERRVAVYRRGYKKIIWEKPRDARNELLDLAVYGLAAVKFMQRYNPQLFIKRETKPMQQDVAHVISHKKQVPISNYYGKKHEGVHL